MTGELQAGGSLTIACIEFDPDYSVIEIRALSDRFSGTTHIWVGPDDVSRFADSISGFPQRVPDERRFSFRSAAAFGLGQGQADFTFRTFTQAGDVWIDVALADDYETHPAATAAFGFRIEPAGVDRFVARLRDVVRERGGEARLDGVPA